MEEWACTRKHTDPDTPHAQKALSKRIQSRAQATYRFLMLPPCGSFEELQFHRCLGHRSVILQGPTT